MDFIDYIASQPLAPEHGLNRSILVRDARAVVRTGGRREFQERLDEEGGPFAADVERLRREWKAEEGE